MRSLQFIFRNLLTCVIALLIASPGQSQDSLRILSWNVQMLPSLAKGGGKAKRAKAIVEQLKDGKYDVIVFQELFHRRSRKIITRGLAATHPHHTRVLNRKSIALKANGGVMLFSAYPIRDVHQIRYKNRTGFDRMARKGALLAEIDANGKVIQVAGTHLQAFGTQEILYSQYKQLAEELLLPNTRIGVPQLICGDFNTLKTIPPKLPENITQDYINRLPRYHYMLHTLGAEDGELAGDQQFTMDRPYNDLCKRRKEYRLLLDYILVRPPGLNRLTIRRQVHIMRSRWHKEHQDLSDHFGLEAVVTGFE